MPEIQRIRVGPWKLLKSLFDTQEATALASHKNGRDIDLVRTIPFLALHIAVLAVFWVGWSPVAIAAAVSLYVIRMFAITGFYHRYFSHRTFRTSRVMQFLFACLGASAAQRGPLWWAANHRHHHAYSDKPADVHSPVIRGLWWSHVGWFLTHDQLATKLNRIRDFARYPELRFLNRFDTLVPIGLAVTLFLLGKWLGSAYPNLGTSGWQMLVWGFVVSTVVLWHGTFTINSLSHLFGTRRYPTSDHSRNNFLLAIITLGEGWHNNHHQYCSSARQGFRWWEIDITYYLLQGLQFFGIIWDIRPVPTWVLNHPSLDQVAQDTDSAEKMAM